jgi:hypothetical protein
MNKSYTSLYLSCENLSKENAVIAIKELKHSISFLEKLRSKIYLKERREYNSISHMNLINRLSDLNLWIRDVLIKKMFYLDVIQIMSGVEEN